MIRTRDPAVLEKCDVVVDVGAVYDPAGHRYDHHQREFNDTMHELGCVTRLSSAGLVYRHFGREVVSRIAEATLDGDVGSRDNGALYNKVYKCFIEHIDGIDNGIEHFNSGTRNYEMSTSLPSRVARLNAPWNVPSGPADANMRFAAAVALVGSELAASVEGYAWHWWPARAVVAAALVAAEGVDPSGQILLLSQRCPWQSHLFELEAERAAAQEACVAGIAKYVVYEDDDVGWRVQAVPEHEGSFSSRLPLPEAWRGKRGESLATVSGIEGCVFVHVSGFIGGHETREGALAMAKKALGSDACGQTKSV